MAEIEYNDFGFTALDGDELKKVDVSISSSTNEAKAVIEKLDDLSDLYLRTLQRILIRNISTGLTVSIS